MTAVDAHVHLWDLAARPQPWTAQFPARHRSFLAVPRAAPGGDKLMAARWYRVSAR